MSNDGSITTPNMGLLNPVPGVTPGQAYASDIYTSLTLIDSHDHTLNKGVQLTPLSLNINSALNMAGVGSSTPQILLNTQAVNFVPQTTNAAINSIFFKGTELWVTDGANNHIQITAAGVVNATGSGVTNGLATAAFNGSNNLQLFYDIGGLATSIDTGNVLLRNLSPNSTYALTLSAPNLTASYQVTLPTLPGVQGPLIMSTSGELIPTTYDQVGLDMGALGSNNILNSFTGISQGQANIIAEQVTTVGANAIASNMNAVGGYNVIINGINSVTASAADTIANGMDSTGANTIAGKMTSGTDVTSMVSQFSTANCNAIANNMNIGAASAFSSLTALGITSPEANTIISAVNSSSAANNILTNTSSAAVIGGHYPVVVNSAQGGRFTMASGRWDTSFGNTNYGVSISRIGTGQFTATWSQSYTNPPMVTCTIDGATALVNTSSITTSGCDITTRQYTTLSTLGGNSFPLTDESFSIIVYGFAS